MSSLVPVWLCALACGLVACHREKDGAESADDTVADTAGDTSGDSGETATEDTDPFADAVVSFSPGAGAGFGQDSYPDVVLGAPEGGGTSGSVDVLSLGQEGSIILEFDDIGLVDGDGIDLLVFENPFPGWYETGVVGVSEDGETWSEWPCAADDVDGGYPGCAGVALVYANSTNGLDATDPAVAGGDAFDLADIGLTAARFVRIRDSGANTYDGVAGGFDLDAVAVVHGEALVP